MSNSQKSPYALINTEKRFFVFTNPKCGGTTVKSWYIGTLNLEQTFSGFFTALKNFGPDMVFSWYKEHFAFHDTYKIIHDNDLLRDFIRIFRRISKNKMIKNLHNPDYFKFAISRDPYERIVSAFVDKFCGQDRSLPWVDKIIKNVNSTNENGEYQISFSQFISFLETQNIDKVNRHWRRQTYILDGIELDQIIDLKELTQKLPKISEQLNVPISVDLNRKRQSNSYSDDAYQNFSFVGDLTNLELIELNTKYGSFPKKHLFFNDSIKAKVRQIYEKDFARFSYPD